MTLMELERTTAVRISFYTCPCGMSPKPTPELPVPFNAAWHRAHRDHHMAAYPNAGDQTVRNLDLFIEWAERGEAS